jgi:uncharacterized protein (UPF0210 family)
LFRLSVGFSGEGISLQARSVQIQQITFVISRPMECGGMRRSVDMANRIIKKEHVVQNQAALFRRYGIPTVFCRASIGPVSLHPEIEESMATFLGKVYLITIRASATLE